MNKVKKIVKEWFVYKFSRAKYLKLVVSMAPEREVNRCYHKALGKYCDFNNPQNLLEKIFWMELYTDVSLWTKCADKIRVREYVEDCGLLDYMPQLYGTWKKAKDIDFDSLPNSFVIKANNGCETVRVVHDKSKTDLKKLRKDIRRWLLVPFGYSNAQLHYTRIKPGILAEEVLPNDYKHLSPISMVDFKVWCINGEPQCIQITYNRKQDSSHDVDLYDTKWNRMLDHLCSRAKTNEKVVFPKPDCLEEMLSIAKKLSTPFPEVRADFYIVNNKPVIGELTFSAGYPSLSDDLYLRFGQMIDLSNQKKIK